MAKVTIHEGGAISFECPGCKVRHVINTNPNYLWEFNGDIDRPTIKPSILVKSGHYMQGHKGQCWCDYNKEHSEDPSPFKCYQCHSFVTDGKIQFLDDCTHELTGQTVEMLDKEE